ncbi:hypothetical protein PSYPI_06600 [Pseudomonas syringae pv. pisi str. 1704B]|uniref:Uncharacterized protein n=1 Tax=Pseudomonas syringae pv. pisi str. 1704B TaxID=629263 RepID=F3G4U0_PSESJ|nr:hypothetical protein PSYPI_06600 [Pseudomonas syringae pv. pisi str. 1704B]
MDYQLLAWNRKKNYRCQPCGKAGLKPLVDFDSNWICNGEGCGKPIEIEMTHKRYRPRWANRVKAEDLVPNDELAFETEGSAFAYVLESNDVAGKQDKWYVARQGHRGLQVDRNHFYYRFI